MYGKSQTKKKSTSPFFSPPHRRSRFFFVFFFLFFVFLDFFFFIRMPRGGADDATRALLGGASSSRPPPQKQPKWRSGGPGGGGGGVGGGVGGGGGSASPSHASPLTHHDPDDPLGGPADRHSLSATGLAHDAAGMPGIDIDARADDGCVLWLLCVLSAREMGARESVEKTKNPNLPRLGFRVAPTLSHACVVMTREKFSFIHSTV
jgi:hypothetical protein